MKIKDLLKKTLFSLTPLFFIFFFGEIYFRVIDFQYSDSPLMLLSLPENVMNNNAGALKDMGTPTKKFKFTKDKNLFWTLQPSLFENSAKIEKAADVLRIASLGCSCTMGCSTMSDSYPMRVEGLLAKQTKKKIEVLNAGVGAYSSYQGLQCLKHKVLKYRPDLITIFFGWNDHAVAWTPDNQIRQRDTWEINLTNFFEQSRFFQACHYAVDTLRKTRYDQLGNNRSLHLRVPANDYKNNLKEMIRISRENKIQPVLITAPAEYTHLEPSWTWPFASGANQLRQVHVFYNEIVRKVAAEEKVPLVDLDDFVRKLPPEQISLFFSDGIHFSSTGCQKTAELLSAEISRLLNK